jgi:hypothetical protein
VGSAFYLRPMRVAQPTFDRSIVWRDYCCQSTVGRCSVRLLSISISAAEFATDLPRTHPKDAKTRPFGPGPDRPFLAF